MHIDTERLSGCGMKEIVLFNGMKATVDDADYDWLSGFRWWARKGRCGSFYAARSRIHDTGRSSREMQRDIMDPDGVIDRKTVVDHINGLTLDNRRANLRLVSMSVNSINCRMYRTNKSGYRGVSWDSSKGAWQAGIKIDNRMFNLGRYQTAEEAALAYNRRALAVRGPEARLNVLPPTLTDADT